MKCTVCGKEFEAKRSTAKYCGKRCRKLSFLSVPLSVPGLRSDKTVTDTHIDETPSEEKTPLSVPSTNIPNSTSSMEMLENTGFDSRKPESRTLRQSLGLCKHKDCWLGTCPGQDELCIYHWRIAEHMPHISPTSYRHLNDEAKTRLMAPTGLLQA